MKRLPIILLMLLVFAGFNVVAQEDAVPTLVPPTLIPAEGQGMDRALPAESRVARIQRDGVVRVGILYNESSFGLLNIRGEVSGFDADLARSMADLWGVEVVFVQVTRQTALEMLLAGDVDFLASAQVRRRELDSQVEFSQSYYRGGQAVMVRQDDGAAVLGHLTDRRLGIVLGSPSANAVQRWQERTGYAVSVQTYLTLEQGLVALVDQEIDGLVGPRRQLQRIEQPGQARILEETLEQEPYALVLPRQDVSLRNLVNATLQYLARNGRMNEIYQANLPGTSYPEGLISVWNGLSDDAPQPAQFSAEITYPSGYVIPRLQEGRTLRVAGLRTVAPDAPESEQRLAAFNRAVVEKLAERWGMPVEFLPDSSENALELVANGQADLAVGVEADWGWADRVDFTSAYLLHGDRLMVKSNSNIESFNELRGGRWVGVFASEPGSADRVNALADSINSAVNIYTMVREQDVPFYLLEDENADVAYGDSLKLIPHVQNMPNDLRMTIRCPACDPWYSRHYVGFALPRNDIDFRLLVEYTLQELALESTLSTLWQPVMLPEDMLQFEIWPGSSQFQAFDLRAR